MISTADQTPTTESDIVEPTANSDATQTPKPMDEAFFLTQLRFEAQSAHRTAEFIRDTLAPGLAEHPMATVFMLAAAQIELAASAIRTTCDALDAKCQRAIKVPRLTMADEDEQT
jgi:hypothetical protein